MKDRSINAARSFINRELASVYPEKERFALSRIILTEVSDLPFTHMLAYPDQVLTQAAWDRIFDICRDLKKLVPIQYILGKTEFYGLILKVSKDTLIPRQETEELVDLVIKENPEPGLKIIDFGTGSGAIAIALCKNMPGAKVCATDLTDETLLTARENIRYHNCNITLIRDNILESRLKASADYDIIVSNPPYIKESEKPLTDPKVIRYEPHQALFVPDNDPLLFYRHITYLAKTLLRKGGRLYYEINEAHGRETAELLMDKGFSDARIIKDINNKDRIVSAIL